MATPSATKIIDIVNREGCRILKRPPRIWVFGGHIEDGDLSARVENPASMRDFFLAKTLNGMPTSDTKWFADLDTPEQHPGWRDFSGYTDLPEFERDACYIARSVILFLESPGAIAELGALSIDDNLPQNTFLVLREEHEEANSYIFLGPVKRIKKLGGEICIIGGKDKNKPTDSDFEIISEHFTEWCPKNHQSHILDIKNPTHYFLLLADIVNLLLVSRIEDIVEIMSFFGSNFKKEKIEKHLQLLHFFELIKIKKRGREKFYTLSKEYDGEWISYSGTSEKRFERLGLKIDFKKIIGSDKMLNEIWTTIK